MKYRRYTTQQVIELSRKAIHAFTNRDMARFIPFLAPDFSFVADDAPLFLQGTDAFLESVRNEVAAPPVAITQEEYTLLAHESRLWVTYGRFLASSPPMACAIHFTFVWRQQQNELQLLHASAAHARPVGMLGGVAQPVPQAHMFDAPSASSLTPAPKSPYCDTEGHIRFLADSEILYFAACGKLCEVHTTDQPPFTVRAPLRSMERAGFLLIHRAYLVNTVFVREICRYTATLLGGRELPIGKEKYLAVRETLGK